MSKDTPKRVRVVRKAENRVFRIEKAPGEYVAAGEVIEVPQGLLHLYQRWGFEVEKAQESVKAPSVEKAETPRATKKAEAQKALPAKED